MTQFLQSIFGRIEETFQRVPSLNETFDPLGLSGFEARVGGIELPDAQKWLNQRPYRLGSWLELQDAPTAAVAERLRPRVGVSNRLRPCLPNEGRKHASLREGGLADPRIAEENWKLALRRRERLDHLDCFGVPTEEEVHIRFGHSRKAAIGGGVPPQLLRLR